MTFRPERSTKPTQKQLRWLKHFSESGNASEAARLAYNCTNPKSATVLGTQNVKRMNHWRLKPEQADELRNVLTPQETLEIISKVARAGRRDADKLRGAELFLKLFGLLKDVQQVETVHRLESTEDLTAEFKDHIQSLKASTGNTQPLSESITQVDQDSNLTT